MNIPTDPPLLSFYRGVVVCVNAATAAEEDDVGEPPYADMIRAALLKLPGRQGNLPTVCAYIEVRALFCSLPSPFPFFFSFFFRTCTTAVAR